MEILSLGNKETNTKTTTYNKTKNLLRVNLMHD